MKLYNLIKVNFKGSEFEKKVWAELKTIPYGQTRSYQAIAIRIGHPKSARAVANACGKNPYPIIIPCHRALRSDGSVGGYSAQGGVKEKKRLLKLEKENSKGC